MTANEIKQAMDEAENETWYEVYGVRTQEEAFELGEIDHRSHVWHDGDDTGEELNGLCCTVKAMARQHADGGSYYGGHVAIIAGSRYTMGEDAGEIIIQDPVVVRILA